MKKLIAAASLLAFVPAAQADHHGDFSHSAEFRARYLMQENANGRKDNHPKTQSGVNHRFKFGSTFRASERFTAGLTLLHNAQWGEQDTGVAGQGPNNTTVGVRDGLGNGDNMILVQEAYGSWMATDDFSVRFGRLGMTMADGSVIDENDYERNPYSFDGVFGSYELEPVRINAWVVKYSEFVPTNAGTTDLSDPEANAYGLSVDVKALPEFLNMVNLHVIQDTKAHTANSANLTDQLGRSILRYGLTLAGDTAGLDYRAVYAGMSGDYIDVNPTTKTKASGSMYHLELGYSLPEMMRSRIYAAYHSDSGDKATSADKNEGYDPYFYNKHYNAGLMDVVNWGNLTYFSLGFTLMPMDDLELGLHYHDFSRSEKDASVNAGTNGGSLFESTPGTPLTGAENDKKKIGSEFDFTAEKTYEGGFSLLARVGMFSPGAYLKDTSVDIKDTYTQFMLQAKMNF